MYYNLEGKGLTPNPYYSPINQESLEILCKDRGHLILDYKKTPRKKTWTCLRCGAKVVKEAPRVDNIINITTYTKNRLKKLFPNDTFNDIIDRLIWNNYSLKYCLMAKAIVPVGTFLDCEYDSKRTKIKIDDDNKETLDYMRTPVYKITPIISWSGNPRVYVRKHELGELVIKEKSYNHIINELIDNYLPFFNESYQFKNSGLICGIQYSVDSDYNTIFGLENAEQRYQRIEKADRFKGTYEANRIAWGLDKDEDEDDYTIDDYIFDDKITRQIQKEIFLNPEGEY